MKYAINTIMKDLNETPQLYFKNLDNDDQAEIYYNEYWKECATRNNIDQIAEVDRKQALLFGRSFKKLNVENGKITIEVIDPRDILIDRLVNPTKFNEARFVMQTGIYRTLDDILNNENPGGLVQGRPWITGSGKLYYDGLWHDKYAGYFNDDPNFFIMNSPSVFGYPSAISIADSNIPVSTSVEWRGFFVPPIS